jgi:Spx/MgsR family transcriptional regulator
MGVATLYGIRNCDTVKKARAWLEEKGVEYRFHDYKVSGVERDRLDRWCRELGWEKLVNRAGPTFRKLPDFQKNLASAEQAMAVMLAHPSVIKRPVLELGERLVVGFKRELYQSLKW